MKGKTAQLPAGNGWAKQEEGDGCGGTRAARASPGRKSLQRTPTCKNLCDAQQGLSSGLFVLRGKAAALGDDGFYF